jgi:peptidoglycan hydrolase CwlO-like protein
MYLIIIIAILVMVAFLGVFSFTQYRENKQLVSKNHMLSELYRAEQNNVLTLKATIDNQNKEIEKFKNESQKFEKKVEELNAEVDRLNNEPPVYVYMDKPKENVENGNIQSETEPEKIEKKETTPDEAMKWLLEKSASLSH